MKRPQGFDGVEPDQSNTAKGKAAPRIRSQRDKLGTVPVGGPKPVRPIGGVEKSLNSRTPKPERKANEAGAENSSRSSRRHFRAATRERHRFERREVRRFTRRSRHRRVAWLSGLGIVAVLSALLAIAVYSPLLALRTITVDGVSKVSADDVRTAVDGQLGTPLALLDYELLRTELEAFPLIRSFSTQIVPPSTLRIHIVERAPVGAVASAGGFSVVDPAGVVLEVLPERPDGIPFIDIGSNSTDSVSFVAVVDVLLALPDSIRTQVDIAQATSKDDVQLVLTNGGQRVRWGSSERSALKARVLVELMATQDEGANVEFDVSAPMSPVVRIG